MSLKADIALVEKLDLEKVSVTDYSVLENEIKEKCSRDELKRSTAQYIELCSSRCEDIERKLRSLSIGNISISEPVRVEGYMGGMNNSFQ